MKDDNDRAREGTLPKDPEEGAEEMPRPAEVRTPELRPLGDLFSDALLRAAARFEGKERPVPLPWPDMADQFGGGLWPGVHVLVSGTGAGKTAWSLQVALHAAKTGVPVAYVGLELEDMQIALRILAEETKQRWSNLYLGKASPDDMTAALEASKRLGTLPFYVEMGRPSGWPVSELGVLVEKMRAKHPRTEGDHAPMLLVLDFLQIVGDETRDEGRPMGLDLRERIGRAAYFARHVARTHDVAVLLVSSAARDKYGILAGIAGEAGIKAEPQRRKVTPDKPLGGGMVEAGREELELDKDKRPIVRRTVAAPDMFVGLGKESGEIEYSADSVTAAIKTDFVGHNGSAVVFLTAKGRATGPSWTELRFNGYRFDEAPDRGLGLFSHMESKSAAAAKAKAGRATKAEDAKAPAAERDPGHGL